MEKTESLILRLRAAAVALPPPDDACLPALELVVKLIGGGYDKETTIEEYHNASPEVKDTADMFLVDLVEIKLRTLREVILR